MRDAPTRFLLPVSLLLGLLTLGPLGCARYEYDLVQPPDLSQHIGGKHDAGFALGPLDYRLRTYENWLVMRVYDLSDEPMRLIGEQSFVVDPAGQSHPLRGQSFAPHSFIKLIFPPMPPRLEPSGPTIGIGVGGFVGRGPYRGGLGYGGFWDPYYTTPRYYTLYDESGLYWQWKDVGEARISLTFQQGQSKAFRHDFVFARRRM